MAEAEFGAGRGLVGTMSARRVSRAGTLMPKEASPFHPPPEIQRS